MEFETRWESLVELPELGRLGVQRLGKGEAKRKRRMRGAPGSDLWAMPTFRAGGGSR